MAKSIEEQWQAHRDAGDDYGLAVEKQNSYCRAIASTSDLNDLSVTLDRLENDQDHAPFRRGAGGSAMVTLLQEGTTLQIAMLLWSRLKGWPKNVALPGTTVTPTSLAQEFGFAETVPGTVLDGILVAIGRDQEVRQKMAGTGRGGGAGGKGGQGRGQGGGANAATNVRGAQSPGPNLRVPQAQTRPPVPQANTVAGGIVGSSQVAQSATPIVASVTPQALVETKASPPQASVGTIIPPVLVSAPTVGDAVAQRTSVTTSENPQVFSISSGANTPAVVDPTEIFYQYNTYGGTGYDLRASPDVLKSDFSKALNTFVSHVQASVPAYSGSEVTQLETCMKSAQAACRVLMDAGSHLSQSASLSPSVTQGDPGFNAKMLSSLTSLDERIRRAHTEMVVKIEGWAKKHQEALGGAVSEPVAVVTASPVVEESTELTKDERIRLNREAAFRIRLEQQDRIAAIREKVALKQQARLVGSDSKPSLSAEVRAALLAKSAAPTLSQAASMGLVHPKQQLSPPPPPPQPAPSQPVPAQHVVSFAAAPPAVVEPPTQQTATLGPATPAQVQTTVVPVPEVQTVVQQTAPPEPAVQAQQVVDEVVNTNFAASVAAVQQLEQPQQQQADQAVAATTAGAEVDLGALGGVVQSYLLSAAHYKLIDEEVLSYENGMKEAGQSYTQEDLADYRTVCIDEALDNVTAAMTSVAEAGGEA